MSHAHSNNPTAPSVGAPSEPQAQRERWSLATGSANRSAEAIITDLVEDPYDNGSYRLDIRGRELDELWRAAERDNRSIYAKIIELNRLSDMASDALNSFRIQGKPVPEEVRKLLTALSPND